MIVLTQNHISDFSLSNLKWPATPTDKWFLNIFPILYFDEQLKDTAFRIMDLNQIRLIFFITKNWKCINVARNVNYSRGNTDNISIYLEIIHQDIL